MQVMKIQMKKYLDLTIVEINEILHRLDQLFVFEVTLS